MGACKTAPQHDDAMQEAFEALRSLLQGFTDFEVSADDGLRFSLRTRSRSFRGQPLFFAAVHQHKKYVSFYLMPVYMDPTLLEAVSPELRKRMQGKSCFNFKRADLELFGQLQMLTQRGADSYRAKGYL